jgi:hypothetical protein
MTQGRNSLYRSAAEPKVSKPSLQNPANSGSRVGVPMYANGGRTDIPLQTKAGGVTGMPIYPKAQPVQQQSAQQLIPMQPGQPGGINPSWMPQMGAPINPQAQQMQMAQAMQRPQIPQPMQQGPGGIIPPWMQGRMGSPIPMQQGGMPPPPGMRAPMPPQPAITGMGGPMPQTSPVEQLGGMPRYPRVVPFSQ